MQKSDIRNYEFIDAIRGLAILGVILVHSSQSVPPADKTLAWFMGEGARGVQLFYVASALTLCMSWAARSHHEQSPIRNFYIRRFFRIAPMFYIAIVAYLLLNGFSPSYWAPNGIEWWFIPVTAAFLHGFHPETITSVVPGGWSIAVEMSFYLIFPLLMIHVNSIKRCLGLFAGALLLGAINFFLVPKIFSYPASQQYLLKSFVYLNFFGQLPIFAIGIFTYLVLQGRHSQRQINVVAGGSLFLLLLAFLYPSFNFPKTFVGDKLFVLPHHIIAGTLFCAFTILLANWPTRLLVNAVTVRLGKLSFSMYLTHIAILNMFSGFGVTDHFPQTNSASLLYFLLTAAVATVLSYFFYEHIEKAGISIGKNLIENLEHRQRIAAS